MFFENVRNVLWYASYVRDGYPGLVPSPLDVVTTTLPFNVLLLVFAEYPFRIPAFSEWQFDVVFLPCKGVGVTDHPFRSVTKCPENRELVS